MLWLICISMLIVCLKSVKNDECNKTDVIVGRRGEDLIINFPASGLREKLKPTIYANITELFLNYTVKLNNNMTIYKNGNLTQRAGNLTEIFITNNNFVVKKTKLQKEDAGLYSIMFKAFCLGQKAVIIAGKPIIKGRSPPNLVLKPEDNYTSIIQLECHSDMGDYKLSMYTVWYKNGMRMTDVDPISSQINSTVDHNGGQFTCLATDYLPCYQRLQTTAKHYDVMNIEECNNVSESEIYTVQPEYPPIDVKLQSDQREIIVSKNEDLKIRCSAKCRPQCDVRWVKNSEDLNSTGSIYIAEHGIGNELKIEKVDNSYEGVYVCLVNNTYGEVEKNFTLSVREATNRELLERNNVIITVTVVIVIVVAVIVIVIMVIMYKKYQKQKNNYHNKVQGSSTEDEGIFEMMELYRGAPLTTTPRHNNSRNSVQMEEPDDINYADIEFNNIDTCSPKIHGRKPDTEVKYSKIDFSKKAPPMPKTIELDSDDED